MKTNSLVIDYIPQIYSDISKTREVIRNVKTEERANEILSKRTNIKNAVWFQWGIFTNE